MVYVEGEKMTDKISVIVPVYNVEKYLVQCLESLIKQTFYNIEIILINDGSTDSSGSICEEYSNRDNRIKVIHKKNGGVSSARNAGLKEASGNWISFVDPDDWMADDMYEILINNASKFNVDIAVCQYVPTCYREVKYKKGKKFNCEVLDYKESMHQLLSNNKRYFCGLWNKIYKKTIIGNRLFDSTLNNGEDLWFLFNIYLESKTETVFCEVEKYYYYIRFDSAANSIVFKESMLKELFLWKEIGKILCEKEEYYLASRSVKYMVKVAFCTLALKISLINTNDGFKLYMNLKNDNKEIHNFSDLEKTTDYIKMALTFFPYRFCGLSWSMIQRVKIFIKTI